MRLRQAFAKERDAIRSRGGMVRMSDALRLGISRKALYPRGRNSGAASQHRPDILMRHDYALRVVTRGFLCHGCSSCYVPPGASTRRIVQP